MDFDAQHKKKIEDEIAEAIIDALEDKKISEGDATQISDFVLRKIDLIKTHEELTSFLTELSQNWPVFESLGKIEQGEEQEVKEGAVAADVAELANEGKIEDAINLAKTVTE